VLYSDGIDFLAAEESRLQIQLMEVYQAGEDFELQINMEMTKVMAMGNNNTARIGFQRNEQEFRVIV
jgi:hypothetical protein